MIVLLGGNQGNVRATFHASLEFLNKRVGKVITMSSLYATQAWGPVKQDDFLNKVVIIETTLSPGLIMKQLLLIENIFGRKRSEKYGPRTLDLDILFFDEEIVKLEWLKIPHPEIHNRRFVLTPLCELVPRMKHPVTGKTMHTLLEECKDTLEVKKII